MKEGEQMKPIFSMLMILSVLFITGCSEQEHETAVRHDLGTAHVVRASAARRRIE